MIETGGRRKPRLLVLTSTYPRWRNDPEPGFVHELSRRLVSSFEVTVIGPHARGAKSFECLDGVNVVRFRYAPEACETLVNEGGIVGNLRRRPWKLALLPFFLTAQWWATRRLCSSWRPDVVHAHWFLPQGLVAALTCAWGRHRTPFLVTSHGADLYALRSRLAVALKRQVAKRASALTVVSSQMLHAMQLQGIPAADVAVMPMGVDMMSRFSMAQHPTRSRSTILFVGRLVEKKGLRHLLDAIPHLLAEFPGLELQIAGFGPERIPLERHADRLGISAHIRFLGPVAQDSLPRLYGEAAVFVAPFVEATGGDQEGLGLVAVEAVACGAPVILGNVAATEDLAAVDPGIRRVDVRDTAAFAAALAQLLRCPQPAEEAVARRNRLSGRYDWSSVAAGYSRLLLQLAAPRDATGPVT